MDGPGGIRRLPDRAAVCSLGQGELGGYGPRGQAQIARTVQSPQGKPLRGGNPILPEALYSRSEELVPGYFAFPRGSAPFASFNYLKAMDIMAGLVARNVADNLFDIQNACVIADLDRLSDDARELPGLGAIYRDPMSAVRGVYERTQGVLTRLGNHQIETCRR